MPCAAGGDEEQVRKLFNGKLITFFQNQQKSSVAGRHDLLLFCRQKERIKPNEDEVQQPLKGGFQLDTLLLRLAETWLRWCISTQLVVQARPPGFPPPVVHPTVSAIGSTDGMVE